MNGSLLRASAKVVFQPPVLAPVGVAVLLMTLTAPVANAGNAHQIRSGVALLLACALAATAEDPAGGIAARPATRAVSAAAAGFSSASPWWFQSQFCRWPSSSIRLA